MGSKPETKRITNSIMIALAIWGLYLAIGATGYFTQKALFDIRKTFIVAIASSSFLLLWVFVLNAVDRRKRILDSNLDNAAIASSGDSNASTRWSKAGLATVGIGMVALLLWATAVIVCPRIPADASSWGQWLITKLESWKVADAKRILLMLTTVFGWLAAISMVASATAGIIALSNPAKLKGKWLGILGLVLCVASFVGFFIRMTP